MPKSKLFLNVPNGIKVKRIVEGDKTFWITNGSTRSDSKANQPLKGKLIGYAVKDNILWKHATCS